MIKDRNIGIDFLKFIAAFLVVNSHIDVMYGKYAFMATGGTIGDVLFFFCSGYTLFLKPFPNTWGGVIRTFPNWYKRRINRIWPSLIVIAIIKCILIYPDYTVLQAFFCHGYWFIDCIMLFYVVLFLIGSYWKWDYKWIYLLISIITFIWFYLLDKPEDYTMYHPGSVIKWLPYFLIMLMGAQMGKKSLDEGATLYMKSPIIHFSLFIIYAALYYLILGLSIHISCLKWIQPFSFLPIFPCIYHIYLFVCTSTIESFVRKRYGIIGCVGSLCLEIYLCHAYLITDKYNSYFPLNIILMVLMSIVFAYVIRCGARFLSQTFDSKPYDWTAIIKMY